MKYIGKTVVLMYTFIAFNHQLNSVVQGGIIGIVKGTNIPYILSEALKSVEASSQQFRSFCIFELISNFVYVHCAPLVGCRKVFLDSFFSNLQH